MLQKVFSLSSAVAVYLFYFVRITRESYFECKVDMYVCNETSTSVAVCHSVLQCVAVGCSVLQCVASCCSVLRCVAACCSLLQRVAVRCRVLQCITAFGRVLQCSAVCRSVSQCVAVCHSVSQCDTAWSSVLQHVAVCCMTCMKVMIHVSFLLCGHKHRCICVGHDIIDMRVYKDHCTSVCHETRLNGIKECVSQCIVSKSVCSKTQLHMCVPYRVQECVSQGISCPRVCVARVCVARVCVARHN